MKIILLFLSITCGSALFGQIMNIKIGQVAPLIDYSMLSTNNENVTLRNAVKESGIIVIFSCNTCPFVVGFSDSTFPGWENRYNSIFDFAAAKKIGVILVNSNEAKRTGDDSMEKMIEHKKNKGYKMPYLLDKNSELANAMGAKTTPHVFFFDKELKLIYTGSIDNSFEDKRKKEIPFLMDAIENHAAGKKIKLNTTSPKGCSIKRLKS